MSRFETFGVRMLGAFLAVAASRAPVLAQYGELRVGVGTAFPAAGDGVTDDTAAIQAALNAVPAGGAVILEPGRTYLVNASVGLRPKSHSRLILDGVILRVPAGQGGRFIDVTSKLQVTITGGTFLGGAAAAAAPIYGVLAVNSSGLTIDGTTFHETTDGILITGSPGGERITVRNAHFRVGRRSGVYIAAGRHVSVENSTFDGIRGLAPEAGVNIQVNAGTSVEHVRLSGGTFRANGMAIHAIKASGTALSHLSITGNTIDGNTRAVSIACASHVVVDGNRVTNHPVTPVAALFLGRDTSDVTVTANVLINNYRGIQADGASMVNIAGNTVAGTGARSGLGSGNNRDGITCGAIAGAPIAQCVVSGNVVNDSAGSGIRLLRGSYMIVSNNIVTDSGQNGISLQTVGDSQVRGNTISRSSLETLRGHDDIEIGGGAHRNLITLNQCTQSAAVRASISIDATSVETLVAQNSLSGGGAILNTSSTTSANWDGSGSSWNR